MISLLSKVLLVILIVGANLQPSFALQHQHSPLVTNANDFRQRIGLPPANGVLLDRRGGAARSKRNVPGLSSVGKFGLWLVPVLVYLSNWKVADKIEAMITLAIRFPNSAKLPSIWKGFSHEQLGLIMKHIRIVLVASGFYHLSSLLMFPMSEGTAKKNDMGMLPKLEALCTLVASLLIGASTVVGLQIVDFGPRSKMGVVLLTLMLLVTLPFFSWWIWMVEFSGRELIGRPASAFLPSILLSALDEVNIWKHPGVAEFSRKLYVMLHGSPKVAHELLDCIVDAGAYVDQDTRRKSKKEDAASATRRIRRGLVFQTLYGTLTGIHLMAAIVAFCPSIFRKGLRIAGSTGGGCPYAIMANSWIVLPSTSIGTAAVGVLAVWGLLVACQVASAAWGIVIWEVYV